MKSLYVSKLLIRQGVTREEAWQVVNTFDKECVLHSEYKYASLLPVSWMPEVCTEMPTSTAVLVLTDLNGKKNIGFFYFYEDGIFESDGKTRRFVYLYDLHAYKDRELSQVEKTLPKYLQECLRIV